MASIRRLKKDDPKSPWVVEYTDQGGKRRRATPSSGLKKDADKLRQKIEAELGEGKHIARSDRATVRVVCESYIRDAELRNRDGRLSRGRLQQIKHCIDTVIIPRLGGVLVDDLTVRDVSELYEYLRASRDNKPLTAKARIKELKLVQDHAVKRGWLNRKPVNEFLPELRGGDAEVIRTFIIDDVQRLLAVVSGERPKHKRFRAHALMDCYVNIGAYCGLRYGEIQALTIENVDFSTRVIKIRHSLNDWDELKGPKTKSGVRDVAMPDHVARALKIWMAQFYIPNPRGLLFRTANGKMMRRPSFHYHLWRPLLERAGFTGEPFHFHALRHFHASWLIKHGMALMDVARVLGHKRFDTTLQVYAHSVDASPQRISEMERIAGLLTFDPQGATTPDASLTRHKCDLGELSS